MPEFACSPSAGLPFVPAELAGLPPGQATALKKERRRQGNRESARRRRERQAERTATLAAELQALQTEGEQLQAQMLRARQETAQLQQQVADMQACCEEASLEQQLLRNSLAATASLLADPAPDTAAWQPEPLHQHESLTAQQPSLQSAPLQPLLPAPALSGAPVPTHEQPPGLAGSQVLHGSVMQPHWQQLAALTQPDYAGHSQPAGALPAWACCATFQEPEPLSDCLAAVPSIPSCLVAAPSLHGGLPAAPSLAGALPGAADCWLLP